MPLDLEMNLPNTEPTPSFLTLDGFKRGVISVIDKSKLPKNALERADNMFLYELDTPGPRHGVNWYGSALPGDAVILGYDYFDFNGAIHLVAVGNDGVVYRSTDDAQTWEACTGATLDTTAKVYMNQYNSFLYITNGVDEITRYDGSTTLSTYTTLTTPTGVSATKTGLAATTYGYHYKVSAVNDVGFSAASTKSTVNVSLTRADWDSTSNFVTVTWTTVTNAKRYDIYISENDLDYYYLGSTLATELSFKDDGTAIPIPSTIAPTDNTTGGPLVEELTNVGSRMYGVRDADNRYRIWFTSGTNPLGAFSNAYDGGYLDWQPGGKLIPKKVVDYRDGKGDPYATIWCDSADGRGGILQMSINTLTIGDISISVPSAYLLPGSRGTPAPGSVVNVLNDYMYYASNAFYNLGSRAQYLNLLSTDEASSNIRPTLRTVSRNDEPNIVSAYYEARVYFSVGARTIIFDTERKAWLPTAFTFAFSSFLHYKEKLLATREGDSRLSEISESIKGDYGEAFSTVLQTGLYPVSKNRFEFLWTEEAEMEFSNPQGEIFIELQGIERTRGFVPIRSKTLAISYETVDAGWDSFSWDGTDWDETSVVPELVSESTIKRYMNIQKDLNAVQWRITTNKLDSNYRLRTLQTWGTVTTSGKPRTWRL